MAAKGSRRLNYKLDAFTPLVCCDQSIARGYNPYLTTYNRDFYDTDLLYQPAKGASARARYELRDAGLQPFSLLAGCPFYNSKERNYNTQYCDDYNQLPRLNVLPTTRSVNFRKGHKGSWLPEKSDNPMIGNPWNYGYRERNETRWQKENEDLLRFTAKHEYISESMKYSRYCDDVYQNSKRYATPLSISSKLFNPRQKLTRGPPPLLQPNEVINTPYKLVDSQLQGR